MDAFFDPGSIAVVGASRSAEKLGHVVLSNILRGGFEGEVYPVNPNAESIEGRACFRDVRSIGKAVDLAVIVVPAGSVPGAVRQCAEAGVKAAVIVSAGFREVDEAGARHEKSIVETARRRKMRVLGPNSLGLLVPSRRLNASFVRDPPPAGPVGYVSQSGAMLSAILDGAAERGIGFSKVAGIGNKADVDELAVLKAFGEDESTRVVAGYLESIESGEAFVREAERVSARKPIVLLKAGASEAGALAATSHTGRLISHEAVYESAFDRAGVIRVESVREQLEVVAALSGQPLPRGGRVGVVTNAGSAGIIAADAIDRVGLSPAALGEKTRKRLGRSLPAEARARNPVDVLGDADAARYRAAMEAVGSDESVDGVVVLLTPQARTDPDAIAAAVVEAAGSQGRKPVLAAFMGGSLVEAAGRTLRGAGVPTYDGPDAAVRTMRRMVDYRKWLDRPARVVKLFPVNRHRVGRVIDRHVRRGEAVVGETETKEVLEAYGFVTPTGDVANSSEQAADIADQIGYPVVMKVWSPDIVHKTDVGGVRLGLTGRREVIDAYDLMMYRVPRRAPGAHLLGVLVQEMVGSGREVILGMSRDPRFGPLMMFGMGGVFVEVLNDVAFHLAPLTADEAREMLSGTRTWRMLRGERGEEGVDVDALAEALQRVSQLATEFPRIEEMDINPLVVGPPGHSPVAVDGRLRLSVDQGGGAGGPGGARDGGRA